MKPTIFKNETDLENAIGSIRVGRNKVMFDGELVEGADIVTQLKALVPKMFELRLLLVKGMGGLGNYKSFERFTDIVSTNVSEEGVAAYLIELNQINQQVDSLVDGGLNTEVAEQLSSAQGKAAMFKRIKSTVLAFDKKFQNQLARVSEKYESLIASLNQAKKTQTTSEGRAALQTAINEFIKVQDSVVSLGEDLHQYCLLQIAYNSSIMD
jgi:hypothetical protein